MRGFVLETDGNYFTVIDEDRIVRRVRAVKGAGVGDRITVPGRRAIPALLASIAAAFVIILSIPVFPGTGRLPTAAGPGEEIIADDPTPLSGSPDENNLNGMWERLGAYRIQIAVVAAVAAGGIIYFSSTAIQKRFRISRNRKLKPHRPARP